MDPVWPSHRKTPYRELSCCRNIVPPYGSRPSTGTLIPKTPDDKAAYSLFGQDLSLLFAGVLLSLYAYEFDYKRYVSMHSTSSRAGGARSQTRNLMVGNYSAALTIEDPLNPLRYRTCLAWWILPPYSTRICCPTQNYRRARWELGTRAIACNDWRRLTDWI
jgi:hypothetical protein